MWLLSNLVAAINPHDLDALDENVPFTKYTLDSLLGVTTSYADYKYYFDCNPHRFVDNSHDSIIIIALLMVLYYYFDSHKYKDKFESFLTTEGHADKIGMYVMILFNVLFV